MYSRTASLLFFLAAVLFFINPSDTCMASATTPTPIVCDCAVSDVALLYQVEGSDIQPTETTTLDTDMCPETMTVTCTSATGGGVIMQFQDQIGGALSVSSVLLTCTEGNWLYTQENAGDLLVTSVQCSEA